MDIATIDEEFNNKWNEAVRNAVEETAPTVRAAIDMAIMMKLVQCGYDQMMMDMKIRAFPAEPYEENMTVSTPLDWHPLDMMMNDEPIIQRTPIPSNEEVRDARQRLTIISFGSRLLDMLENGEIHISNDERVETISEPVYRQCLPYKNNRKCNNMTRKINRKATIIIKNNNQGRQLYGSSMRSHKRTKK